MTITNAELIFYGSANMPEADTGTAGGAISLTTQVIFDSATLANAPDGDGTLKVVSDGSDTRTVTVTGRNATGSIVSDAIVLDGTTPVAGAVAFERILKIVMSTTGGGRTVLVKNSAGSSTIVTIPSAITTVRRPFYDVVADVAGTGDDKTFYEKIFLKNTNSTLSLLGATITEVAGGVASIMGFALGKVISDASPDSVTNRLTAPDTTDDNTEFATSGSISLDTATSTPDLVASGTIAIWLKLFLEKGTSTNKSTYTLSVTGTSI